MKIFTTILLLLFTVVNSFFQVDLNYFLSAVKTNSTLLLDNENAEKQAQLQSRLIEIQNKSVNVNLTSEVYFTPFFNNNGELLSITTTPEPSAVGYDINIWNGGLYSLQLNLAKELFNNRKVENLQFQNNLLLGEDKLTNLKTQHLLEKKVVDTYVLAYQLQSQKHVLKNDIVASQKRIDQVELLVEKEALDKSDYLLIRLDQKARTVVLKQVEINWRNALHQLYDLSSLDYEDTVLLTEPIINLGEEVNQLHLNKKYMNDSLQIKSTIAVFDDQYKPQLNLYANTGVNSADITNVNQNYGVMGGLRLSIPIYDGGQKKLFHQQQRLYQESLTSDNKDSKTQLQHDLKNLKIQIADLNENLDTIDEQLEIHKELLRLYETRWTKEEVSTVDFLNIVQEFRQTQFLKIQMQTNRRLLSNQYNFMNW